MHPQVRILGPPQVVVDDAVTSLAGRQLLLAVRLAIADRRPVPATRLLADVWPTADTTEGALRVGLTRLRSLLGPAIVERHANGYTLSVDTTVDAVRFNNLLRGGKDRARTIEQRISAYDEALNLWRGSALEGLERVAWVEEEAVRLEETREQAIDERFELHLLMGGSAAEIPELRPALDRQPTRERRAELLATALYRTGRQADALAVLEATRVTLRDTLGLDPGRALRELELRILRHDEELSETPLIWRDRHRADIEGRLRSATSLARVGAFDDALRIIDDASALAVDAGDRASYAFALLARAQAGSLSGQLDPHPLIDQAIAIGRDLRDGPLLARCAMMRFGSGIRTDKMAALVEIMEPLDLLPSTAAEQLDLLCLAAIVVTVIDAAESADRLVTAAERLHMAAPTPRSEAVLLASRCLVGSLSKVSNEQLSEWADRSYAIAIEADDDMLIVVATHAVLRTRYLTGDLVGAEEVLDELNRAASSALLPFGSVRVNLCRTTNALARGELDAVPALLSATRTEGARLRTFAAESAAFAEEVQLLLATDRIDELLSLVQPLASTQPPGVWLALVALCTDSDASKLLTVAPDVARDGAFTTFVAISAEVAARDKHCRLGEWCARELEDLGAATVASGFGTIVTGFAEHFAGLAYVAMGDHSAAAVLLESACTHAEANGAHLWRDWSRIELAAALGARGGADPHRAAALLIAVANGHPIVMSARLARRHAEISRHLR